MNASFTGLPKSAGNPTDILASESAARHQDKSNQLFFDGNVSCE
jgi:prepilin-type processing-associated H-X9-DG protein